MHRFKYITLIFPVYNEKDRVERVLSYYEKLAPVIVIDNYSTDGTMELARAYSVNIIQYKNNGTTQTREWMEAILPKIDAKHIVFLSASEFIPICTLQIFDEIAKNGQYGMVNNVIDSYTCGEKIPLWGGRIRGVNRRVQRFFAKDEIDLSTIIIHGAAGIKDMSRVFNVADDPRLNIIHIRDSDAYSLMAKHLDYARVEALEIMRSGRRFGSGTLMKLLAKECARFLQVPVRQWHAITVREIWARLVMHTMIFWQVWELRNSRTLSWSREQSEKLWNQLIAKE